jgi:hypothetical protein
MRIVKFCLAGLAALWTIGVAAGVIADLGKYGGTIGTAKLAAGIGVTAAFAAITFWLFQWALRKPTTPPSA